LDDHYTVEAGTNFTDVPLHFYRNDNIATEEKKLTLQLVPTDDFGIGIPEWRANDLATDTIDVSHHSFVFSGFLPQPARWSGGVSTSTGLETANFGLYGMKKLLMLCELLDLTYDDFTSTTTMPSARQRMVMSYGYRYLQQRYNARNPILEDDGRLMWISGVTWTSKPGVPWDGVYL
jgi:hypothetical protein